MQFRLLSRFLPLQGISVVSTVPKTICLWMVMACFLLSYSISNPCVADDGDSGSVQKFLKQYCADCHGGGNAEGDFELASLSKIVSGASLVTWDEVLQKVATSEMPPADSDQPAQKERSEWVNLLQSKLHQKGFQTTWSVKRKLPEYGNYLNHDRLFNGTISEPAWSPSRLWKRSPYQFDSLVIRGLGIGKGRYGRVHARLAKVKQPFTIEERAGILDYAEILYADSATLATLMRNAEVIVDNYLEGAFHELKIKKEGPIPDDQLPKDKKGRPIRPRPLKTLDEFREVVLADSPASENQIRAAVTKMFELVVERKPEKSETKKYTQFIQRCIAEAGNGEGLRTGLVAIAVSPQAVYRSELGQGAKDQFGRQILGPADLAYAIAFALTDEKPDEELLAAAKEGRLVTREDVRREVTRIWDDKEIEKPRVLRFFREFFGYHNAPKVFKDTSRFGKDYRNVPENLVDDCDTLILHIVDEDRDVLKELLTTDKYFVGHDGDTEAIAKQVDSLNKFYDYLKDKDWKNFPYQTPKPHMEYIRKIDRMFTHANGNVCRNWMKYLTLCDKNGLSPMPRMSQRHFLAAYNLDDKSFSYPVEQPFSLAPDERIGVLMHPAWLIAHSLNLDNDPIRRGKWIRERLLADTIPELPITVDAQIPDVPTASLRERLEVTRKDECWRCHRKMNPLGLPFEQFDDFGRYRKVEKLQAPKKTCPVDASGVLDNTGSKLLDGEVDSPIQLMSRLAESDRVRQSFVRHAFRYWMGRNEQYRDSSTLIAAEKAYRSHDGSFRSLVISLLTSDSFLYRKDTSATR